MPDRVSIAILHGQYESVTVGSLAALVNFDLTQGGKHLAHKDFFIQVGTTNIASGRNTACRSFLDGDADWLLFLDADEAWNPNLIEELLDSADVKERPIISGLIMARRERDLPISPACGIFDDHPTEVRVVRPLAIPNTRWWQVATVGAGCLLIHRRVLETIRDRYGEKAPAAIWFDYTPFTYTNPDGKQVTEMMGEDYVFSARASACGFPLLVDTSIELGHVKDVTLTRELFHQQMANQLGARPVFVVVPVKDKLELTKSLVADLRAVGGWDGLLIYDNGSGAATKQWLAEQPDLLAFDAKGAGIHEMWNAGVEECLRRSGDRCDILFLNNDLRLGPSFVNRMVDGLRSGQWAAVSANYDKRDGDGVEQVRGICGERYDGTGGLAGFAFAVRSEWFVAGYRFPTDAKWWFGDTDLVLSMDGMGARYGVVVDATVEHDGAGTAGDWRDKRWQAQLAADRDAFNRKWSGLVGVTE